MDGRSVSITSVDNTEYYTLPDPTSDYTSEESGEQSGCSSGSSPPRHSPPRREEGGSGGPRRPPAHPSGQGARRRAVVLCQYRRKSVSEVRVGHSLPVHLPLDCLVVCNCVKYVGCECIGEVVCHYDRDSITLYQPCHFDSALIGYHL